jgi:uncharacterized DUF497 family protein
MYTMERGKMYLPIVWDEEKNQGNIKKHGISFQEASQVFDDPHLMEFYDKHLKETFG